MVFFFFYFKKFQSGSQIDAGILCMFFLLPFDMQQNHIWGNFKKWYKLLRLWTTSCCGGKFFSLGVLPSIWYSFWLRSVVNTSQFLWNVTGVCSGLMGQPCTVCSVSSCSGVCTAHYSDQLAQTRCPNSRWTVRNLFTYRNSCTTSEPEEQ